VHVTISGFCDDCPALYANAEGYYLCGLRVGHPGPHVSRDREWVWREGEKPVSWQTSEFGRVEKLLEAGLCD
jgi:hypothetical protein